MIPIDQTIVSPTEGNCMQAVVASLFEKELHEVPVFLGSDTQTWWEELVDYFARQGHLRVAMPCNRTETLLELAEYDGGVNGYFFASVKSPTFEGKYHAVVCDKKLNIVHDPNPNKKSLLMGPNDIVDLLTVNGETKPYHYKDGEMVKGWEPIVETN